MCVRNSQVGSSCYSVLVSTNDFFCALEKYIGEFPAPLRPPLITVNFASLHFFFFLLLSCREMIILGKAASIDGKICISCIAIFFIIGHSLKDEFFDSKCHLVRIVPKNALFFLENLFHCLWVDAAPAGGGKEEKAI